MSNEITHPPSLACSILQMIQAALTGSMTFNNLTHILSLLCLLSILQRMPQEEAPPIPPPQNAQGVSGNTSDALQRMLGQLTKSDGGSGDALMNLLPLLNSPQLKSKMTPTNIATILGLINTMGVISDNKPEKDEKEKEGKKDSPAATVTTDLPPAVEPAVVTFTEQQAPSFEPLIPEKPRCLEWKTNF